MKRYMTIVLTAAALALSSVVLACPCNKHNPPGDQAQAVQTESQSSFDLDSLKATALKSDDIVSEDSQTLSQ